MKEVKTKSGFECSISEDVLDDWDLLEAFKKIDSGDYAAVIDAAPLFLGNEQFDSLKKHLRDDKGKLKASLVVSEISEIIDLCGALKN